MLDLTIDVGGEIIVTQVAADQEATIDEGLKVAALGNGSIYRINEWRVVGLKIISWKFSNATQA